MRRQAFLGTFSAFTGTRHTPDFEICLSAIYLCRSNLVLFVRKGRKSIRNSKAELLNDCGDETCDSSDLSLRQLRANLTAERLRWRARRASRRV